MDDSVRRGLTRRQLLASAAGGALAAGVSNWPAAGLARGASRIEKPNILVLLADDQRFDTIRMLGNPAIRTPNLDALAARGTSMAYCFNQGAWGEAVGQSSRAMMQTGRHLFRVTDPHDARKAGSLDTKHTPWAEHFKNNGYDAFATGKWTGNDDSIRRSFVQARALFLDGMHAYNKAGKLAGVPIQTGHQRLDVCHFDGKQFTDETLEQWSTEVFAKATVDFLKSRKGQARPFFAHVGFTAPHDPRHAPERYLDLYDPDKIDLPPNFMAEHPFDFGIRGLREETLLGYPRDEKAVRQEIAAYYAMISHLDDRIGDIVQALKASGQADNTYIVFTSDHGLALGRHGLLGKQNLYDHSIRVPMVWSGPGVNPGEISEELVYLHSLYATTCELAELDVPGHVQAPSLVPVMAGASRGEKSIYGAYADTIRMLRTDRYKLLRYPKLKKTQLFNLQDDPWETKDLSDQPAQSDRIKQMSAALVDWETRAGAPRSST